VYEKANVPFGTLLVVCKMVETGGELTSNILQRVAGGISHFLCFSTKRYIQRQSETQFFYDAVKRGKQRTIVTLVVAYYEPEPMDYCTRVLMELVN
jgi:hypothetical protein